MAELIAKKTFVYASRRLIPGQDFHTKTARDAKILIALGKARAKRVPGTIPPPPAELAAKIGEGDMKALRAEYQELTGKRAFHGWDAPTLRAKIGAAAAS